MRVALRLLRRVYRDEGQEREEFENVMANLYGTKPEETACLGCMQDDSKKTLYAWCKTPDSELKGKDTTPAINAMNGPAAGSKNSASPPAGG